MFCCPAQQAGRYTAKTCVLSTACAVLLLFCRWLIRSTRLQDSCQVVLFYDWDDSVTDTGLYAESGGGLDACENKQGYNPNWDEDGGSHLYPLMCSDGSSEKTSSQIGDTVSERKVIESSYMRELNGTHVPYDSWMTYEIWDGWCEDEGAAYDGDWATANCEREDLINPARQPLNGNDLLREVAESVSRLMLFLSAQFVMGHH